MSKKHFKLATSLAITIILTLGLSISFQSLLAAWQAPGNTPPNGNTPPPIYNKHTTPATNALIDLPLGINKNLSMTSSNSNIALGSNWLTGDGTDGEGIYINSSGNVGIGTNNPSAKLEVVGGAIKATGGLIIETRTSDPASPVDGQIWLRTDL